MAKDDYFVVIYQVLKYLYACLKQGVEADVNKLNSTALQLNRKYWAYIMLNLLDSGYIKGIHTTIIDGVGEQIVSLEGIQITPKGIEYLFDNSMMTQLKNTLKEIKDIVPFI